MRIWFLKYSCRLVSAVTRTQSILNNLCPGLSSTWKAKISVCNRTRNQAAVWFIYTHYKGYLTDFFFKAYFQCATNTAERVKQISFSLAHITISISSYNQAGHLSWHKLFFFFTATSRALIEQLWNKPYKKIHFRNHSSFMQVTQPQHGKYCSLIALLFAKKKARKT